LREEFEKYFFSEKIYFFENKMNPTLGAILLGFLSLPIIFQVRIFDQIYLQTKILMAKADSRKA